MKKLSKFMEYFWLVVAIITSIIGIWSFFSIGLEESGIYLLLPFVAFTMYGLRRYIRLKTNNYSN